MSRATKRKNVLHILDDYTPPTPDQQIVKVVSSRGNNLHAVETPDGANFLVSMPTKFRRNLWIKRGNFVVIDPIKEGDKVKGEIVRVLRPEHIKCFKEEGVWPSAFQVSEKSEENSDELFVNTNRGVVIDEDSSSESEESDDD